MSSSTASIPPGRKARFVAFGVVVLIVIVELVSTLLIRMAPGQPIYTLEEIWEIQRGGIRLMLEDDQSVGTQFDPQLGWVARANYTSKLDDINAIGVRSIREYAPVPPPGKLRVAAYGDSFVYGAEINTSDAWSTAAERADPDLEVLNYAVSGYGFDQAYMRYQREAKAASPQVVLIGLTPVTPERLVNVCSTFYAQYDFSLKPRYRIDHGDLVLVPNPVAKLEDVRKYLDDPESVLELGKYDYWYEPLIFENPLHDLSATVRLTTNLWYRIHRRFLDRDRPLIGGRNESMFNVESESYEILTGITRHWVDDAKRDGQRPILVMFPDMYAIERVRMGLPHRYSPYVEYVKMRGYEYLDLADVFGAQPPEVPFSDWIMQGLHYTPAANALVGKAIAERLQGMKAALVVPAEEAAAALPDAVAP